MAADWGASLERLFAKKGVEELKASKAVKKVVKAAAQHSNRSAQELSRQLEEFLRRWAGGRRLPALGAVLCRMAAERSKPRKGGATARFRPTNVPSIECPDICRSA